MTYDLILRGGKVVLEDRVATRDLAISDGQIAVIGDELDGSAAEEIDVSGQHILPGVIDAHVHFNDPGRANWEGIETGSAALAVGGGTCFIDMPLNASPPTLDAGSFDAKVAAAQGRAATDFALWGGLVPGNLERLDELAERGVVGFKAFMSGSGMPDFQRADDLTLLDGMRHAARLDLPVAVHAESDAITSGLAARAVAEGRTSVRDFLASRPVIAEVEALQRAILFAGETGCALHIVHVSSGEGVALVAEARTDGVDVSCETCPHYLLFTEEDVERIGAAAKCAPPIRAAAQRERLWDALANGQIDLVASDHSPSPPDMKEGETFFDVWGGIAGCQTLLSVMLHEGHVARSIPLVQIAQLLAAAPAHRFRLPNKGRIAHGYDADLAVVDLTAANELRTEHLQYRHPITPYLGLPLHGMVQRVLVRGITVAHHGRPTDQRPGRLVERAFED